jgi:YgiT-type zinc finger domain-containing protein
MSEQNILFPEPVPTCRKCQAGHLRRRKVTYFTWLMDELITVPDFPAWVCDVCGRRVYDPQAITQLSTLLNPTAGKPSNSARRVSSKQEKSTPRPAQP